MARYTLDEEERAQLGELDEDALRTKLEEGLLKQRKLERDLKAYADGVKDLLAQVKAEREAVLDEFEGRRADAGKSDEKAAGVGQQDEEKKPKRGTGGKGRRVQAQAA